MPSGEGSAAYGCCGPGDDGPAPGMHLGSGAGGSADDLDVFRLGPLLALGDVELDPLPLLQAAVAGAGDRAEVHEHVLATLDSDEAIAPVAVEPLHSALRHLDLLSGGCSAAPSRHARPALARSLAASLPRDTPGGSTVRLASSPAAGARHLARDLSLRETRASCRYARIQGRGVLV